MNRYLLERVTSGLSNPDTSVRDIVEIVAAACVLQSKLYVTPGNLGDSLFTLRKALEGVFGHDIPDGEE